MTVENISNTSVSYLNQYKSKPKIAVTWFYIIRDDGPTVYLFNVKVIWILFLNSYLIENLVYWKFIWYSLYIMYNLYIFHVTYSMYDKWQIYVFLIQQLVGSMKTVQRLLKCLRISSYFLLEISVAEIGSLNLVGSMRTEAEMSVNHFIDLK